MWRGFEPSQPDREGVLEGRQQFCGLLAVWNRSLQRERAEMKAEELLRDDGKRRKK